MGQFRREVIPLAEFILVGVARRVVNMPRQGTSEELGYVPRCHNAATDKFLSDRTRYVDRYATTLV